MKIYMILDLRAAGFREKGQLRKEKGKREVSFMDFLPLSGLSFILKLLKENMLPQ